MQAAARPYYDQQHRRRGERRPGAGTPEFAYRGRADAPRRGSAIDPIERGIDPRLNLFGGFYRGGLAAYQRLQQPLLDQAYPAAGASVVQSAAQMLDDRALFARCQFAVGMRREIVGDVLFAVHVSPCLYTQARI